MSTNDNKIGEWIEKDDEKKAKAIFKAKLKYGEHWAGTTTLKPGQRLTVVNGVIKVD